MKYDVVEIVIDKLIRTFGLKDWQYEIDVLIEDIAEALKLVGASKVFIPITFDGVVSGSVVKLPASLYFISQVLPASINYTESGRFLTIDEPDGTPIKVIGKMFPTDDRGFPLVPDNAAVREAVMWYMVKNLVLRREIVVVNYQTAEAEWQWRCGSARADLNILNLDAWNKIAQNYSRLNPLKNQHQKNYVDLGKGNTLDRDKYRYYNF